MAPASKPLHSMRASAVRVTILFLTTALLFVLPLLGRLMGREQEDFAVTAELTENGGAPDDRTKEYSGSPDSAFDEMEENEYLTIVLNGDLGYSESFLQQIEQMNILNFSWITILNIAGAVVLLLLTVIIMLEVRVIRRIRKARRAPAESPAPADTQ